MKCVNRWPIGVCSWSLHNNVETIKRVMQSERLSHLHLHVAALEGEAGARLRELIASERWTISATMVSFPQEDYSTLERIRLTGGVRPDAEWPDNQARLLEAIATTARMGVPYLSFHAGFLDHNDPAYAATFEGRIRAAADAAAEQSVMLLMETGQESALDLRHFMEAMNHPALGINFDPANMILYDKDAPIDAVRILGPWIKHVHVKDATRTRERGTWGAEVPWGDGEVNPAAFMDALRAVGFHGALAIEREAGEDREGDVALAVARLTLRESEE